MARDPTKQLTKLVTPGAPDVTREDGRRHLVSLVDNNQVPRGLFQQRLRSLVA